MEPTKQPPAASATQDARAATASGAEPDLTGQTLGEYQILRRLGQGGMGQVYLAEQLSLKRKVALKLLKAELAANEVSLKRFQAEAENVARATHANIVQVYAIQKDESRNIHYMALEYVEGRNLREYLEKKGALDLAMGLGIMRQVAAALQRASELGIIHRDIKPENILLTRKGEVKVADFGLSRVFDGAGVQALHLTQSGVTMGTPLYMSPEQVEGKTVDPRSDIYSFGVTCYHMFAGRPPFRGASPFEVALQHVQKAAEPLAEVRPDLPADLCGMIQKMMAKKPEERYQTCREIVREVARLRDVLVTMTAIHQGAPAMQQGSGVLAAAGVAAAGVAPVSRAADTNETLSVQRFAPRRFPWKVACLGAALLLALGAGLYIGYRHQDADAAGVEKPPIEKGKEDDPGAIKAGASRKEREEILRRVLDEYITGKKGLDVTVGMKTSTELGLLLLKEPSRWPDAEKLFADLDEPSRAGAYRALGKLGKAVVLAFKDEATESNKLFLQVLHDKGDKLPPKVNSLWRDNAAFAETMARAINHNFVNLGVDKLDRAKLPPDLQILDRYRRPPPAVIKGAPAAP
ncbi:MAG: serine/threonine-protein kinase [Gemmataceae bacterium]